VKCRYEHPTWGRCRQDSRYLYCEFHERWMGRIRRGVHPDESYHRKIVEGLLQPTWSYLTEVEANTTLRGRRHQDGRRLDLYVVDDPIDWGDGVDEEDEDDVVAC
jgi:hypothetical protein